MPGSGMSPVQSAAGLYQAVNALPVAPPPSLPPVTQAQMPFNGYQQQPLPLVPLQPIAPHQPYGNSGGDYSMMRQGSNNSLPPYPHPPAQQYVYQGSPHGPAHPHQHILPNPPRHIPSKPPGPIKGGGPPYSHLPNYGNPATLPQKPST